MRLFYFPLSTYSQKVLIALYEKAIDFQPEIVDLRDPDAVEDYRRIYPLGKIPLLVGDQDWMIPESSIIIEYLDTLSDYGPMLIPRDAEIARQMRSLDRMNDLYLNDAVTTVLFQSWKATEARDQKLIDTATYRLNVMYDYLDKHLEDKAWMAGQYFTLADCAAVPALFYAQDIAPFSARKNLAVYWRRVQRRQSYRRVTEHAAPYLAELKTPA